MIRRSNMARPHKAIPRGFVSRKFIHARKSMHTSRIRSRGQEHISLLKCSRETFAFINASLMMSGIFLTRAALRCVDIMMFVKLARFQMTRSHALCPFCSNIRLFAFRIGYQYNRTGTTSVWSKWRKRYYVTIVRDIKAFLQSRDPDSTFGSSCVYCGVSC